MNTSPKVTTFAAGLLALAMVSGVHVAVAQQELKATDIAFVDVYYLMEHAAATNKARGLVEQMRTEEQKAFEARVDAVTNEYEAISDRRAVPSEDEYRRRFLELQKKAEDYQNEALEREDSLVSAFAEAMRKIGDTIEQIVNEIIQEQKLSMVLSKSAILGTTSVPDITQEVLTRLDQRLPTVTIEMAEVDKAGTKQ